MPDPTASFAQRFQRSTLCFSCSDLLHGPGRGCLYDRLCRRRARTNSHCQRSLPDRRWQLHTHGGDSARGAGVIAVWLHRLQSAVNLAVGRLAANDQLDRAVDYNDRHFTVYRDAIAEHASNVLSRQGALKTLSIPIPFNMPGG